MTCEIFVLVDACGDYTVGKDETAAREQYEDDIGALSNCDGFRLVKVTVNVIKPEIVELTGDAPSQGAADLVSVK